MWLGVGLALFKSVRKAARKRYAFSPSCHITLAWLFFSAGAAEVTRYYLTFAPFSHLVWAMSGLAVGVIGTLGGLATGWFIGGSSFGIAADILAGILGALVVGWAEITSSYNYFDCVVALIVLGPVFATLALRLYARAKNSAQRSEELTV
jgi:uncharacterized membrane protein YeaQ/YmgE (transglycosylase-associated protein family)